MKKSPDVGFFYIIICILLCALCPFLILPWFIIYALGSEAGITEESVIGVIVVLGILLVIVASPILTVLSIFIDGIEKTIEECWLFILVTLAEIAFSVKIFLIPKIKEYMNSKNHK